MNTSLLIPVVNSSGLVTSNRATSTLAFPVIAANTETVTIGSTVYTFATTATLAGHVAVGANVTASRNNLVAAINGDALNPAHLGVTAAVVGTTVVVTSRRIGTAGNGIATTETLVGASNAWGAAATAGGVNSTVPIAAILTADRTLGPLVFNFAKVDGAGATTIEIAQSQTGKTWTVVKTATTCNGELSFTQMITAPFVAILANGTTRGQVRLDVLQSGRVFSGQVSISNFGKRGLSTDYVGNAPSSVYSGEPALPVWP